MKIKNKLIVGTAFLSLALCIHYADEYNRDKNSFISNSTNNHMSFTIEAKASNKKMKFPFIFLSPLPKSGIESSLFCKNYRNTLIIYSYYNEEDF